MVEKDQGRKMMPILICQQCGRMFEVKRYFAETASTAQRSARIRPHRREGLKSASAAEKNFQRKGMQFFATRLVGMLSETG